MSTPPPPFFLLVFKNRKKQSFQFCELISCYHFPLPVLSGKIPYTDVFKMLQDMDPPLGFGKRCPERMAYKKLIRMNMPMDPEGKVRGGGSWLILMAVGNDTC